LRQREETPDRVRAEVDFKSNRGYKPLHMRIREQALFNKQKHMQSPATDAFKDEKQYEQVEVND
jgi:hypothetical protein